MKNFFHYSFEAFRNFECASKQKLYWKKISENSQKHCKYIWKSFHTSFASLFSNEKHILPFRFMLLPPPFDYPIVLV